MPTPTHPLPPLNKREFLPAECRRAGARAPSGLRMERKREAKSSHTALAWASGRQPPGFVSLGKRVIPFVSYVSLRA